jgi:hypothetical protein
MYRSRKPQLPSVPQVRPFVALVSNLGPTWGVAGHGGMQAWGSGAFGWRQQQQQYRSCSIQGKPQLPTYSQVQLSRLLWLRGVWGAIGRVGVVVKQLKWADCDGTLCEVPLWAFVQRQQWGGGGGSKKTEEECVWGGGSGQDEARPMGVGARAGAGCFNFVQRVSGCRGYKTVQPNECSFRNHSALSICSPLQEPCSALTCNAVLGGCLQVRQELIKR